MEPLIELIQQEAKKVVKKATTLSSVPCFVTKVIGDERYEVKTIFTNDIYVLPNFSGSSLAVGENVKIYYQGSTISPHSAYIGASLTKKDLSGEDIVYLTGISNPAQLQSEEKVFAYISLEAVQNTTVTFSFNANIEGEQGNNYLFKFFVNGIEYDYYAKGSVLSGSYDNCQVVLPISLTKGESTILVKGIGSGTVEKMMIFVSGQKINEQGVKIRELTGTLPLSFVSNGDNLLDWRIRGATGGVGKLGDNYLKQTEVTIPSGSYGERVYTTTSWITARIGTFNSGQATTIGFNLHKSDNSNITPANVGKMYIVEGDGDPEAEGIELVIFQGGITQMGDDSRPSVYHLMRYGDDGTGNIQQIKPDGNAAYIPIRCGTALFELEPDTDYKFARVGGDADVEIQYVTGNGTRTVSVEFANTGLPAIPDGGTTTIADAQWCKMTTSERYNFSSSLLPVDNRAESYENCTAFADLKAGHYKVIAEAITKDSAWLSTMLLNDNVPYFMLIDDSNNKIISRTQIFQTESLWNHEEYEFTLSADAKVGLFFKAYYGYASSSTSPVNYIRFMIVDYDKTSVSFDISSSYGQLTGDSCWEPYRVTLPITIQYGDLSTDVELSLGTEFLGENDTISYLDTETYIPTYSGMNTIYANTENEPSEMYIKYKG